MFIKSVTDVGLKRQNNQDFIFSSVEKDLPLFILADGMGGHNAGEVASESCVDIIKEEFSSNRDKLNSEKNLINIIKKSIKKANENIYNKSLEIDKLKGMGTTLTLAYILKGKIYIGHVGDSRAYFVDEETIKQITEDHSLVNQLVKSGSISKEQAKTHPKRNVITKALGAEIDVEMDIYTLEYRKDDILMICSDGLTNMLNDREIFDIIHRVDIENSTDVLIKEAKKNGGLDNISIIIVKFT